MSSTLSKDGTAVSEPVTRGRHAAPKPKGRIRSLGAMPGSLVHSLARSITAPAEAEVSNRESARRTRPAPDRSEPAATPSDTIEVLIADGESVSDVAARFGVSTASLLALNGLGWRSPISAGDTLLVRPGAPTEATASPADEPRRHRVLAGETINGIAELHGIAPAALLLANGLSRTSTIETGRSLVLPAAARRGSEPVVLTGEMRENAAAIIGAGRELGVPDDGIVVALVAAMQDSCLHNLDFGEDDALGIFQQRTSDGWGTEADLLDVRRAARSFFRGPAAGRAVGLLAVPGWEFLPVGEVAAAVQRAATPAAYGKWERSARTWLAELDRTPRRRDA